jgi:hypothetical protein
LGLFGQQRDGSDKYISVVLLVLSLTPVLIYRALVAEHQSGPMLDSDYYLTWQGIFRNFEVIEPRIYLGIFMGFRLLWFVPLYVLFRKTKDRQYRTSALIGLILIGTLAQLVFAADTTRLMGLAFLGLIVSVVHLRTYVAEEHFKRAISALFFVNLLLPNSVIMPQGPVDCSPLPIAFILDILEMAKLGSIGWVV